MKILFITANPDVNTGSYRIWVRDLCKTLKDIKIDSDILSIQKTDEKSVGKIQNADVIIFGKCCYKHLNKIKNLNKKAFYGVININSDYVDAAIDFVIVGSPEEYTSLRSYENVFIYPLIERQFENVNPKIHSKKDKIRLCYHGHYPHLSKFDPHLKNALDKISEEIDITLVIITGHPNFDWKIGKPENVKIEYHKYDLSKLTEIITSCDIGIVPNICDLKSYLPKVSEVQDTNLGWGKTDYIIRYKNKTNAGRSFVFYQHGIPVIHDLSPSSFEIMGSTQEYCVAHDTVSWAREIKKLCTDHKERQRLSEIYLKAFKEKYDPHVWAEKLVNNIKKIKR
tara:strand:+ start:331 stop:1347 length:1017 start_codon:yes stop_codon:yes gene_type:complete